MLISVTFKVSLDISIGTSMTVSRSFLQQSTDSGTTYNAIINSNTYAFHKALANGSGSATSTHILQVEPNHRIRIRTLRHTGTDTLKAVSLGCSLTITQL